MTRTPLYFALSITLSAPALAVDDIAHPDFVKAMEAKGIQTSFFNQASSEALRQDLRLTLAQVETDLETAEGDDEEDLEFREDYLKAALSLLDKSDSASSLGAKERAYLNSLRAIYSMESDFITQEPWTLSLTQLRTLASRLDTDIPYVKKSDRDKAIGLTQAKLESKHLINPATDLYVSTEDLAAMSINQIAALELPSDHPMWYSDNSIGVDAQPWDTFESWMNKYHGKASKKDVLKKLKKEAKKEGREFDETQAYVEPYNIHKTRKVLFLTKLKSTGTSAKANTKDAYGQGWKIKWGNEIQSEPVANRLAMRLGAKFTDLVYANPPGREGVVLVLEPKDKAGDCDNMNTFQLFRTCLMESEYAFNVDPYIVERSTLTESNIDSVLKNLPVTGLKKYTKENLIGREYVTFKESQIEFRSDEILLRGGATAWSGVGALNDRVKRGNFLFTAFIKNVDQKDDNTRGVLVEDMKGCPEPCYIEFNSDLGASFGAPSRSMEINDLGYGRDFMFRNLFHTKIKVKQAMLFRPIAWDISTFADQLWMAKKIVRLTKEDLAFAAEGTNWPGYMKETLVYRLQKRRNQIAKIFDIQELLPTGEQIIPELNISYSMKTPEDRMRVAKKYGLSLRKIEDSLRSIHRLSRRGVSYYTDKVVSNGRVNPCHQSLVSNLLEKQRYPTGLSRRKTRGQDSEPLEQCEFTGKATRADNVPPRKP